MTTEQRNSTYLKVLRHITTLDTASILFITTLLQIYKTTDKFFLISISIGLAFVGISLFFSTLGMAIIGTDPDQLNVHSSMLIIGTVTFCLGLELVIIAAIFILQKS